MALAEEVIKLLPNMAEAEVEAKVIIRLKPCSKED